MKQSKAARTVEGLFHHEDFPSWDEEKTVHGITEWFSKRRGRPVIKKFEYQGNVEHVKAWFEGETSDLSSWEPLCEEEGAILLSIHDTESHGPVAIFFVPLMEQIKPEVIGFRRVYPSGYCCPIVSKLSGLKFSIDFAHQFPDRLIFKNGKPKYRLVYQTEES